MNFDDINKIDSDDNKIAEFILKQITSKGFLEEWYIDSVLQEDEPKWTEKHIKELTNDFYVIPKEALIKAMPITELDLSVKTAIMLAKHDIYYINTLLKYTKQDISKFYGCFKSTLEQIEEALSQYNLSLEED